MLTPDEEERHSASKQRLPVHSKNLTKEHHDFVEKQDNQGKNQNAPHHDGGNSSISLSSRESGISTSLKDANRNARVTNKDNIVATPAPQRPTATIDACNHNGNEPAAADILLGRGKPFQSHPGNLIMLDIVDEKRAKYNLGDRKEKHRIIEHVLAEIRSRSGRFIMLVDESWVEVKSSIAYRKVGHAFRSKARQRERRVTKVNTTSQQDRTIKNLKKEVEESTVEENCLHQAPFGGTHSMPLGPPQTKDAVSEFLGAATETFSSISPSLRGRSSMFSPVGARTTSLVGTNNPSLRLPVHLLSATTATSPLPRNQHDGAFTTSNTLSSFLFQQQRQPPPSQLHIFNDVIAMGTQRLDFQQQQHQHQLDILLDLQHQLLFQGGAGGAGGQPDR